MKMMMIFMPFSALMLASSRTSGRKTQTGSAPYDGSSADLAIPVKSVGEEYTWIYSHYPNSRVVKQSLISQGKKHYDLLVVSTADGEKKEFYFDISSFFGKW